jgi:hypothetical protein
MTRAREEQAGKLLKGLVFSRLSGLTSPLVCGAEESKMIQDTYCQAFCFALNYASCYRKPDFNVSITKGANK